MKTIFNYKRRYSIGIFIGLYFYFLLPTTAVFFYEMYHLTGIDGLYIIYGLFKAGGYYFESWEYRLIASFCTTMFVIILPLVLQTILQTIKSAIGSAQ
jgi:hypothetical protein